VRAAPVHATRWGSQARASESIQRSAPPIRGVGVRNAARSGGMGTAYLTSFAEGGVATTYRNARRIIIYDLQCMHSTVFDRSFTAVPPG
jgi:hypothetical protein